MTTTEASLDRVDDIIDEYLNLGLDGIFLRPLSPFGFAIKTKQYQRYDAHKWLRFYERGLRRVLEINRQGTFFREFYAALILTRMLTDKPIGYVDLRSPAGIGIGVLVYNYDGSVDDHAYAETLGLLLLLELRHAADPKYSQSNPVRGGLSQIARPDVV
ncbi:hypothetical protein LRP30_37265 [Bradyrhizobium sp. C-145]|uniref:hypothetical protein n=1 Tax=Bradyrhizobium sp. C-145 TaxID=574727 RepID=UPI00201B8AB0|nr:hypothetical protein [Bradyrhizobium sp. C-145]UQR62351.1 hypothetical protein LRP30_37265 [Bradyrhizobium sp. C-145]